MNNPANPNPASVSSPAVRTCPRCGLTETTLRTEGLLGCATCYETFADLVVQAVAALHGVTIAPKNSAADTAPETPLPIAVPGQKKTISWLTRRPRIASPSPPKAPPPGSKPRKKPSAE